MSEEHSEYCPKCGSGEDIVYSYSMLLTLAQWPVILMFSGTVIVAGSLFGFNDFTTFLFNIVAILPLCCCFLKRKSCLRCGIQFGSKQEVAKNK
ncbi:hypothetical protein OAO01_01220 [Oligoflexia bacterium]|nr:hypothetical protein [Oligoflexia bacterium]